MSEFSEWFVLHRKRLELTQAALSKKLGCLQSMVYSLEKGQHYPNPKILGLLENLYGQTAPSRAPRSRKPNKPKKPLANYESLCFPVVDEIADQDKENNADQEVKEDNAGQSANQCSWMTTVLLSVKNLANFYAHCTRGIAQDRDHDRPLQHQDAVERVKYDCDVVTTQLAKFPVVNLETPEGVYRLRDFQKMVPRSVPCWEIEFPQGAVLSLQTAADKTVTEVLFFHNKQCVFALLYPVSRS